MIEIKIKVKKEYTSLGKDYLPMKMSLKEEREKVRECWLSENKRFY